MRPVTDWDESYVQSLINTAVQEHIGLDYKGSPSLQKTDRERIEISKDVSAFANSAGGIIVYGVVERNQVPKKIDIGYDPIDITREWLEQVIMSKIQPRIDGLIIKPIDLFSQPGRVIYAVEIPQSFRGPHQAADKKYYRRYNFLSVPMEDYEIRDALRRAQSPDIHCSFQLDSPLVTLRRSPSSVDYSEELDLGITIVNRSAEPALYAAVKLYLDRTIKVRVRSTAITYLGQLRVEPFPVEMKVYQLGWTVPNQVPLLEGLAMSLPGTPLGIHLPIQPINYTHELHLGWEVHAPNMPVQKGAARIHVDSDSAVLID